MKYEWQFEIKGKKNHENLKLRCKKIWKFGIKVQ